MALISGSSIGIANFGTSPIVPAAMLSGVYKIHSGERPNCWALFWAHAMNELTECIQATKPG